MIMESPNLICDMGNFIAEMETICEDWVLFVCVLRYMKKSTYRFPYGRFLSNYICITIYDFQLRRLIKIINLDTGWLDCNSCNTTRYY